MNKSEIGWPAFEPLRALIFEKIGDPKAIDSLCRALVDSGKKSNALQYHILYALGAFNKSGKITSADKVNILSVAKSYGNFIDCIFLFLGI